MKLTKADVRTTVVNAVETAGIDAVVHLQVGDVQHEPLSTPTITPGTTQVQLADPVSIAQTMTAPSSMLATRLQQRAPKVDAVQHAAELAARLLDANHPFDQAVLEVIWYASDLTTRNGYRGVPSCACELIHRMSFAEMERIAAGGPDVEALATALLGLTKDNARLRHKIYGYGTHGLDAADLQNAARTVLAYRFLQTVPERGHLTVNELSQLAAIEHRDVITLPLGWRFDARAPDEVRAAGGFLPNPARQKKGSLFEHSVPGVGSFGGGFVSLSSAQGNAFNLAIGPVVMNARQATLSDAERDALLLAHTSGPPQKGAFEVLVTWEYEMADVTCVAPEERYAIAGEKELVASVVEARQITRARPVQIIADVRRTRSGDVDDVKVLGSVFGAWQAGLT